MMKKFVVVLLMMFCAMPAFADSSANANASAGATSVVNNAPTVTSTLGSASVSQNGDMSVSVAGTSITFEGSKAPNIPPPAAYLPQATGSVPQIFGPLNETVNEAGIELTLFYNNVCPSKMIRGYDLKDKSYSGVSQKTEITFSPHLNYAKNEKELSLSKSKGNRWENQVNEVEAVFGAKGNYKCLGVMTITADNSKARKVPFSTILSDAKAFPIREMDGFPKIVLISPLATIVATKGVGNQGGGLGLGAGASQFFDPILGTLGASAGTSSGISFPESKLGLTFIVAVEVSKDDPEGVFIDLSEKKPEPMPVAVQKIETPVPLAPVVAESKPGVSQEVVTIPTSPAKETSKPVQKKKKVVKKPLSKAVPPPAMKSTVIECDGCIIKGTVTVPPKVAKPTQRLSENSIRQAFPSAKLPNGMHPFVPLNGRDQEREKQKEPFVLDVSGGKIAKQQKIPI